MKVHRLLRQHSSPLALKRQALRHSFASSIYGGLGLTGFANLTSIIIVLSIVAFLTMTLGNLVAAVQSNVKRMMAYSSIAQAGYILVGFIASLATGKPDGTEASLFFILVYVVTNLGAFAGIIALADLTGGERIADFRGLWQRAPLLSLCTASCLLSSGWHSSICRLFE